MTGCRSSLAALRAALPARPAAPELPASAAQAAASAEAARPSGDGSFVNLWSGTAYPDLVAGDNQYISGEWQGPSYAITPNCIPEPGTLLLLGSGLLMGAGYLRRKRNSE